MTTSTNYFSQEQKATLDPSKIPKHIAIVPDGNRRWAENRDTSREQGHRNGANSLMDIIRAAKELGVKAVTVYTFSTENWSRDQEEVQALMWLIDNYLKEECQEMVHGGVKLATIGDLTIVPDSLNETIDTVKQATAQCDKITMILAINYGSRNEICRAVQAIVDDYSSERLKKKDINESLISAYLDTAEWPDPDLFIRTSGEQRISNYLLWQISYAELYFTEVYWPDFKPIDLLDAVKHFQQRKRRLGS